MDRRILHYLNEWGEVSRAFARQGDDRMMPMESQSRWTAAVYLAGGENVAREMIPALHDLRDASLGNREALSTLAQFEPGGKPPRRPSSHG